MNISPLSGICIGSLGIALVFVIFAFLRGSPGLRSYILTRVVLTLPMVFILVTVIFFIMRVIPGDPVSSELGPRGSEAQREHMREQLGLNDPIMVQYVKYLGKIVRLDLGEALVLGNRPIVDELSERLPATLELTFPAMAIAVGFGVLAGAYAAQHRKKGVDYGLRLFSIAAYSIPVFWLGLILQVVFGIGLDIAPIAGRIDPIINISLDRMTNILTLDALITGNWRALGSALHYLFLPSLALATVLTGVFLRLSRINVIESLVEDYILAGRARGIRERVLVYKRALSNALIPIVTLIGLQFSGLLAGAILTETTFSWPGMGLYLVERIGQRDYTAVQGVILVFALSVAMISLLTDIIYAFIDPRVRY
ncbi:MAG TPA: ABC transporter permease [Anaerolineae bacterium]|nr:ABC transporter permease [Anaerolineae bacterium]